MIGGYDFYTNKFNNATQAYRQTGSCFQAVHLHRGGRVGHDARHDRQRRADQHRRLATAQLRRLARACGDLPLKTALAKSMNIPAVHLLQTVGIQTGAQMVRRFGIKVPMAPYLPSALGATEVPLDQMVSAYSAFPNKGIRVEPHMIRRVLDRDGAVLKSGKRQPTKW